LWLTDTLLRQASQVFDPAGEAHGYGGSGVEEVTCETMPGQVIVAAAVFWGIMLFGLGMWIATRRLMDAGRDV
jgi:hypothetical protein